MMTITKQSAVYLLLFLILLLTIGVYSSGLNGDFLFDDGPNIVNNKKVHIEQLSLANLKQAAFSLNSGPLMRPISYLSFALNYYFSGLDPFYFKATNLAIHLFNGILIFWLTQLLLKAHSKINRLTITENQTNWISLSVCAIWVLHPINLTGVLYIVQRMASLSAFFVFLGLAFYAWGRTRQLSNRHGASFLAVSLLVCGPLAIYTKESGALLPFLMFAIEWSIFQFKMPTRKGRQWLIIFFIIIAIIPAAVVSTYLLTHVDWLNNSYVTRDYSLTERLLTETRVVWFYLQMTLLPNISSMGMYHDDIPLSTSLFTPISTVFALTGILLLLISAIALKKRAPIAAMGILFFLIGHSMESSVFSLEIAHEHRNYLPSFGLLFPCIFYLLTLKTSSHSLKIRYVILSVFISFFALSTAIRASYWGDWIQHAFVEAKNHPNSARMQYQAGRAYLYMMNTLPDKQEKYYQLARERFETAYAVDNYNHSGLFALIHLNSARNLFPEPEWINKLSFRLEHEPFAQFTAASLAELNKCQLSGKCLLKTNNINRLFNAALKNPTLQHWSRSTISSQAMIQALSQHNFDQALLFGRQAIKYHPQEIQYRLNLVSVLIQTNHLDEAQKLINEIKAMNPDPLYVGRLNAQERALITAIAHIEASETDMH